MKLDTEKVFVDESRSNPAAVALAYPDCPISRICMFMAVGFGSVIEECEYLKQDREADTAECLYTKGKEVNRMSYSLLENCFKCTKGGEDYKSPCIDKLILINAIHTIHYVGNERGHLGSGSITLDCANFEENTPTGAPPA